MINTLREDILEFLRLAFYHNDFNKNVVTDEIMKLIGRHNYISKEDLEKRIDELLKHYDDVKIEANELLVEHPFLDGRIEGIKEVKEILKS